MQLPEAESLVAANKRIGNILKKADAIKTPSIRRAVSNRRKRSFRPHMRG